MTRLRLLTHEPNRAGADDPGSLPTSSLLPPGEAPAHHTIRLCNWHERGGHREAEAEARGWCVMWYVCDPCIEIACREAW